MSLTVWEGGKWVLCERVSASNPGVEDPWEILPLSLERKEYKKALGGETIFPF